MSEWLFTTGEEAPDRLRGKEVRVVLDHKLRFEIDMPEDATPNELAYFRWFVGEKVAQLQEHLGPEAAEIIGTRSECWKDTEPEILPI
jgi:hypothetical protein